MGDGRDGERGLSGHVSIRRWAENDAAQLAAMYTRNRDEILAHEPWRTLEHFTEPGQRSRMRDAGRRQPPFVGWVVEEDGDIVGTVGLDEIADGCGTLGYWIDGSRRRRGLARVAVELALEEAVTVTGLQRVVANTRPENEPSIRLLQRLGFDEAGTISLAEHGEHLRFVRGLR